MQCLLQWLGRLGLGILGDVIGVVGLRNTCVRLRLGCQGRSIVMWGNCWRVALEVLVGQECRHH